MAQRKPELELMSEKSKRVVGHKVSAFAKQLSAQWRKLGLPGDSTVVVAVSGGADSTALMLALEELTRTERLQLKLIVAHLDHGLRADSRDDARWVSRLSESLGFDVVVGRANLKTPGQNGGENLEQAARKARYEFLSRTAQRNQAVLVLTAHTLDDQAETILMRLLRGSAAEGLSGMRTSRPIEQNSKIMLVRPLLACARREDSESYCRSRGVDFRDDEMNDDESFSRIRVRKQLLPLLRSFNNRVVEALSRTGDLLAEDAAALGSEATLLLAQAMPDGLQNNETAARSVSVSVLLQKPAAIRRRALREWISRVRGNLNRLEMVHLIAVEKLMTDGRGGRFIELPGGMIVTRRRGMLELSSKKGLKKR